MKLLKSLILGVACVAALTSCEDWLDVNQNPNSATDNDVAYFQRLPHIQFYVNHAYNFGGMRTNMGCGDWTMNSRTLTYGAYSQWEMSESPVTTIYQWFFVGAASNFPKMFEKTEEAGAWHYKGVTHALRAYGFMLMTDLYGEMPYTEAHAVTNTPSFDTGKTIYIGCLNEIEEAIKCLEKEQAPLAKSLSEGDYINNGDVDKWIKFCYLMKARWINKLNKKGAGTITRDESGKITDVKWDAQEILNCLAKAQQSNADNTMVMHSDDTNQTTDVLGWAEPVTWNGLHSVIGMNSNYYVTEMLVQNLTNFDGKGIEDPRADKILPWAYSKKSADSPAELKWSADGNWRRTLGVDMSTNTRILGHPYTTSWNKDLGKPYNNTENTELKGDTVYVQERSTSTGYEEHPSILFQFDYNNPASATSGTFHTRVNSPSYMGCYHEACFIKAEVLFRQNGGPSAAAYAAYKEGIKANMEIMNKQLDVWQNSTGVMAEHKSCPAFQPMTAAEIDAYLNSAAVGTQAELTLAKIMTQKRIAMMFTVEQYNDMRRYDWDSNVFKNWGIPFEYYQNSTAQKFIPLGKHLRRWRQCSLEYKYNADKLHEIGYKVPGADMTKENWNMADDAWTIPVWWDSDQE